MKKPLNEKTQGFPVYQPYSKFTAQSRTVSALFSMYSQLDVLGDRKIELTPLVVFLAFSVESYLNSLGARKVPMWDEMERLPWKTKMVILHNTAKQTLDWGKEPLQFAVEIFRLRDRLAHGKPETVFGPLFTDPDEAQKYDHQLKLQPQWYAGITKEWVIKAKERFRLLMVYLGALFGLHESDHLLINTGAVMTDDGQGPQRLVEGCAPPEGIPEEG